MSASLFIRDSARCKFIVACQQFRFVPRNPSPANLHTASALISSAHRTRDCTELEVALCCHTLPIIESTDKIAFSCFRGTYFALNGQFSSASVHLYNNNWARIHDFTPNKEAPNYTCQTEVGAFFESDPVVLLQK